ncbi:glutamyl-tRNA reductase [Microbacterium thalassium]|uniref:Glutamyl-tRNA reductase n=1 Tax=Microbacterium thalassium TaxID=362649 RepID=A0A7X0FRN9_9MICO|nr:glutamyl-tRNA reductase [Microbacterium thalassium]MBB6392465.1 glutamyl-tRNA reductase [Microbacterium thalassium]GLK23303.1 glutamyl-tRNA reductase [Microbacterium thalassium]
MLFCLSASHSNTAFDVLDRLSRVADETADEQLADVDGVNGAIVLATCNRFEAYLDIEASPDAADAALESVLDVLPGLAEADLASLRATASTLSGDEVVRHLFSVSSGLESMVLGEDEITGQVQRALASARRKGTTTPSLERMFQRAAHTTREVRAQQDLAAAGRSLVRVALDMVESRLTAWATTPVLVVGTGRYAATTIAALNARGAEDITVFSATGRAAQFAARYGIRAAEDLRDAVSAAEVVITCTTSYTVTADHVPDDRARLVVDLGLPRNVDPSVGELPGLDLLDLELIGRHAALPELGGGDAHRVVGAHAARFTAERDAAPAIVAVREHIQAAVDAELAKLRPDDPAAEATAAALRHLAGVLSHTPSVRAREHAQADRLDEFEAALEMVFGVSVDTSARAARDDRATG